MQPTPPPRRRTGRTVLIVIGVVALVCCLGAVGLGVVVWRVLDSASEGPRNATHAFVDDMVAGRTDEAYGSLCAETKGRYTREDFDRVLATEQKWTGVEINGFNVTNNTATVDTTLSFVDGTSRAHEFELVEEGGTWKVCGDPY